MAANLLNESSIATTSENERYRHALLNLRAARRAVDLCAYDSAQKFAVRGIALQPQDDSSKKWDDDHYEVTMELYSIAAEAECCTGRSEVLEQHFQEVATTARHDKPVLDKIRVYTASMTDIANQDRAVEARDLCIDLLRQLGCKFPKKSLPIVLSSIVGLVQIKSRAKKITKEDVLGLPMMKDRKQIEIMRLLDKLATFCYITTSKLFPLVILRSFKLTLQYGLSEFSPSCFGIVGLMLAGAFRDFQGANVYAMW